MPEHSRWLEVVSSCGGDPGIITNDRDITDLDTATGTAFQLLSSIMPNDLEHTPGHWRRFLLGSALFIAINTPLNTKENFNCPQRFFASFVSSPGMMITLVSLCSITLTKRRTRTGMGEEEGEEETVIFIASHRLFSFLCLFQFLRLNIVLYKQKRQK